MNSVSVEAFTAEVGKRRRDDRFRHVGRCRHVSDGSLAEYWQTSA